MPVTLVKLWYRLVDFVIQYGDRQVQRQGKMAVGIWNVNVLNSSSAFDGSNSIDPYKFMLTPNGMVRSVRAKVC